MSDEWGPWIKHDGKGCPVPDGVWCHRIFSEPARGDDKTVHGKMEDFSPVNREWEFHSWNWSKGAVHIIRYRIRNPRALELLRSIAKEPEVEIA